MTVHEITGARACRLAALMVAVAGLSACGGSDDPETAAAPAPAVPAPIVAAPAAPAPAPVPAQPAPAPAAAPTFMLAAATMSGNGPAMGHIFDVEATPVLQLTIPEIGEFAQLYPSQARSADVANFSVSALGYGQSSYVRAGKVYTVNLRRGAAAPVELQVSSLTTACSLADQFEVAADGSDTWFRVEEAGADGNCATSADNRQAMVRTTGSAASAPILLPPGMQMLQRLAKPDLNLRWLLANDTAAVPPKLVLYDTEMAMRGDVAGGTSAARVGAVVGYDTPLEFAYLRSGSDLKRLNWDAAGASLSPSLYTFTSAGDGNGFLGWPMPRRPTSPTAVR